MTDALRPQKRGRRIAMTDAELQDFLATERTCRVATVGRDGPHATALWFVWHDGCLWLTSLTRSQRWADLQHDQRIGVVVDAGEQYLDLRGVEIVGAVQVVGEVPRSGEPVDELEPVETAFAGKYFNSPTMPHDGRHAWLKVVPSKIVSWDFRKLAAVTS